MEASRGPPRVKNKAPGKTYPTAMKMYMLIYFKPLSRLAQNSYSVRPSTGKNQGCKRLLSDSQISKSFMNSKVEKGRSLRIMCEGIG